MLALMGQCGRSWGASDRGRPAFVCPHDLRFACRRRCAAASMYVACKLSATLHLCTSSGCCHSSSQLQRFAVDCACARPALGGLRQLSAMLQAVGGHAPLLGAALPAASRLLQLLGQNRCGAPLRAERAPSAAPSTPGRPSRLHHDGGDRPERLAAAGQSSARLAAASPPPPHYAILLFPPLPAPLTSQQGLRRCRLLPLREQRHARHLGGALARRRRAARPG